MATEVRGVVSRGKGEPVTVETVLVPDTGPGEAVVDVQACGVCHTDLHYRDGGISDDYPFLLGHEAAGTVTAVGEGVTGVQPGDYVILNWRAVCGVCRACARGRPWYCFSTHNAAQKMTLADGTELSPALGIGALAEKTLVAAGQCTKVDPEAPATAAGLLGCGVMAGLGAAINTGGVSRGDTVAVYGCGGVGAAAIAGARLAGARTIVGVDIDRRKLGAARSLGATHAVNAAEEDPVAAIQKLGGANQAIALAVSPKSFEQAYGSLRRGGTLVFVALPADNEVTVPIFETVLNGITVVGSIVGTRKELREVFELHAAGKTKVIRETRSLDDVNEAIADVEAGRVAARIVFGM